MVVELHKAVGQRHCRCEKKYVSADHAVMNQPDDGKKLNRCVKKLQSVAVQVVQSSDMRSEDDVCSAAASKVPARACIACTKKFAEIARPHKSPIET
jgi:hypothetical protein